MLATDLRYRLSDHFVLGEAVRSDAAARRGIDNRPPVELLPILSFTAKRILEPVRAQYGVPIRPSSWYRCLELNRAIGSRDTSQHVTGHAVDFEVAGVANVDLARWIRKTLDFDQLILEFHDPDNPAAGWVHASYVAKSKNRQQVLTLTRGAGYAEGLPE